MLPDPIKIATGVNQNLMLYRGEDKVIHVDLTGYDLTAATAIDWWLGRSAFAFNLPSDVFIKKSLGDGVALGTNSLDITLAAADTLPIRPEIYYHELKFTGADSLRHVVLTGNAVIVMSLGTQPGTVAPLSEGKQACR
jgi:hypothetical protein